MTSQDCSICQTKQLQKDFQCYPWSQVSWLVWQTPGWALPQYSKVLLPKQIRTASWRSKVVPDAQKTSLKVDECVVVLKSEIQLLCSPKKFATEDEQSTVHTKTSLSLKKQKPIHFVTKRPGSCFLSYCESFLPVQSAAILKAWSLVTNKISSQTSKVFQSY